MKTKYKLTVYVLLLIIVAFGGFIAGVNYAVNNTMIIDKVNESSVNIQTINDIKNNKLEDAIKIQLFTLETNIEIIDSIDKSKRDIIYLPRRSILAMSMLNLDLNSQKQNIKKRYQRLKNEIK